MAYWPSFVGNFKMNLKSHFFLYKSQSVNFSEQIFVHFTMLRRENWSVMMQLQLVYIKAYKMFYMY